MKDLILNYDHGQVWIDSSGFFIVLLDTTTVLSINDRFMTLSTGLEYVDMATILKSIGLKYLGDIDRVGGA